jgi:hypothetical protein
MWLLQQPKFCLFEWLTWTILIAGRHAKTQAAKISSTQRMKWSCKLGNWAYWHDFKLGWSRCILLGVTPSQAIGLPRAASSLSSHFRPASLSTCAMSAQSLCTCKIWSWTWRVSSWKCALGLIHTDTQLCCLWLSSCRYLSHQQLCLHAHVYNNHAECLETLHVT